jgi:hypothetical protein
MAAEKWSQFFDFSFLNEKRMNRQCKLCRNIYKDRRGIYSNFIKHLKRIHPIDYEKVASGDAEQLTEETNIVIDDEAANILSNSKHKNNQFILSVTKNLIIKCGLPLHLVEQPAFREFLKTLNAKVDPISAKKIKRVAIPAYLSNVLDKIHTTLNKTNDLTLTIDAWSDRRCRSYLGITCHFIDEKMMPVNFLIDFKRFKSPHTAEDIQQLTEEVLEKFSIKEKVFRIITDNASSMIKAYKFGLFRDEKDEIYGN